jgi:hypothetical protein
MLRHEIERSRLRVVKVFKSTVQVQVQLSEKVQTVKLKSFSKTGLFRKTAVSDYTMGSFQILSHGRFHSCLLGPFMIFRLLLLDF